MLHSSRPGQAQPRMRGRPRFMTRLELQFSQNLRSPWPSCGSCVCGGLYICFEFSVFNGSKDLGLMLIAKGIAGVPGTWKKQIDTWEPPLREIFSQQSPLQWGNNRISAGVLSILKAFTMVWVVRAESGRCHRILCSVFSQCTRLC